MRKIATTLILSLILSCLCPMQAVFAEKMQVSAAAAILMEAGTGEILYAKNEHEQRAMASITKIMTTLLTIESGDLDEPFKVANEAVGIEGSSMGLEKGDIVTKRALCYGMMLPSGNDAANAAAIAVGGSVSAFVKQMNSKAKELGMENTNFVTPSGLDANGHYTTAYDMALLTRFALSNPTFSEISCTQEAKVSFGNPPQSRWLYNGNKMLGFYEDAIGVKTGYTENARRTLVSAAERDGITLIAVTLNDSDDWDDHIKMLDYGYSLVKNRDLDYDYDELSCPVVGSQTETIGVMPSSTPRAGLTDAQVGKVTARVYMEQFVYAPISVGDIVGHIEFMVDDNVVATTSLLATRGVDAYILDIKPGFFESIGNFFMGIYKAILGWLE